MNLKVLHRAFGIAAFLIALITYLMTVQPTVPFWDCGEFSAAAIWQQTPHPPGAPLFLMIGKVFHTIIPFGDPGWRVNLVSALSSAIVIWLLYLITVKVIEHMRFNRFPNWDLKVDAKSGESIAVANTKIDNVRDAIAVYGSAFISALALTYSDTFWFNAVESEVYAMSTLFVAVIVYLMMRWNEDADNPGHERYLLMIAYVIGLSIGVHLLSILAIFSIVYLVYYRKYKPSKLGFVLTGLIAVVIFFVIYPGIVKWIPSMLAGDLPMKNDCREHLVEDKPIMTVLALGGIIIFAVGFWWSYQVKSNLLRLVTGSFLLIVLGYTTYAQILLRSNANPPMNENEPKDFPSLASYLGREQYGEAPNWPRRYQNEDYFIRHYNKRDENGEYVYGEWFPPQREYVPCNDGKSMPVPKFKKTNFWGEISYFWKYQNNHMYWRYFLWNYMGRISDVQDAGSIFMQDEEVEVFNYKSGYADEFPVRFFALPLIFGLIGLFFHFHRDPKMAFLYLTMFLMMGVLAAISQNQQQPQPRERDYFYAGSFFVFCMWIGIGAYYFIDLIGKRKASALSLLVLPVALLLVPVNMAVGGWKIHSRANNYLPFDYSYNILQSVDKDAIIFTNGDNDTFPLWYLQDVMGVRRDVRIVNLSLANTLWYVDQLKNRQPWGAKKVPLTFADDSIQVKETDPNALQFQLWEPFEIVIDVKPEILKQYTNDPEIINSGEFRYTARTQPYRMDGDRELHLFQVRDQVVLEILRQTKFERPVYYSTTVGPDAYLNLEQFFRTEGMAMRICPVPQNTVTSMDAMDFDIMEKCLMNVDNSDNFSKTPKYGFKFRNLNNLDVYYDEVHRRLMINYRQLFFNYAGSYFRATSDTAKATTILDSMNSVISPVQFPLSFDMEYKISKLYEEMGAKKRAEKYARMGIKSSKYIIDNKEIRPELDYYESMGRYLGPYRVAAYLHEALGEYTLAKEILMRFRDNTQTLLDRLQGAQGYQEEIGRLMANIYDLEANIDELTIMEIREEKGPRAALDSARKIYDRYMQSGNRAFQILSSYTGDLIRKLEIEIDSSAAVPPPVADSAN